MSWLEHYPFKIRIGIWFLIWRYWEVGSLRSDSHFGWISYCKSQLPYTKVVLHVSLKTVHSGFNCVHVYMSLCGYMHLSPGVWGGHKMASDSWELELQTVSRSLWLSWCVCWGPNFDLSKEQYIFLTDKPSLQSPVLHILSHLHLTALPNSMRPFPDTVTWSWISSLHIVK